MRFCIQTRSSVLRRFPRLLGVLLMPVTSAAVASLVPPAARSQPASDFVPVTDEMLQIDRDNVGGLRMVWMGAGSRQRVPLALRQGVPHAEPA